MWFTQYFPHVVAFYFHQIISHMLLIPVFILFVLFFPLYIFITVVRILVTGKLLLFIWLWEIFSAFPIIFVFKFSERGFLSRGHLNFPFHLLRHLFYFIYANTLFLVFFWKAFHRICRFSWTNNVGKLSISREFSP